MLYPLIGAWALLWPLLVLAATGVLLVRARPRLLDIGGRAVGEIARADTGPDAAPAPPARPRNGGRIRTIALPSALDDYDLHFSAVVHWRWSSTVDLRLRDPMGPAVLAVVTRAAELVRETDPSDEGMAECELAARLAFEHAVLGSGIVVWADAVELRLSDADAGRLRRTADLRKDRALREATRVAEDDLVEIPVPVARPRRDTGLHDDPLPDDPLDLDIVDDPDPALVGPGSDVDGEGYESYWWPAEDEDDHDRAERDVQVAILRGMIDSLAEGPERDSFVRDQVRVLERGGFDEVARRIRAGHPEPADTDDP
ncbi:hypothetical protein PWG71_00875 [Nocardiopsis sp. N85]|uniref:hypothetical protein n=1 Tax=Nocardiopsis sp. N85 TaxID=3029400 RepID=UPI00237F0E1A|nr:hypothetical protein [Nocardiopsis sp. N85]MDE3719924.1 hypothetical protein [Nocardiopsis sp. N85]